MEILNTLLFGEIVEVETRNRLGNLIENILNHLDKGADFIIRETPLMIQDLIMCKRIEHTFYVGAGLLFLLMTILIVYKIAKKAQKAKAADIEGTYIGITWLSGFLGFFISFSLIIVNVDTFIKIWFAPKIYLLEYIKGLLK